MTKYGKKICEIVESSRSHMTAEQVFAALRQAYPGVVRATVYNNLNRLCAVGRLRRVKVEGQPDRYDRTERHDHLVCRRCGKLLDVRLDDLTEALQRQVKVPILAYDLKLEYLCEDCRARESDGDAQGKEELP